MPGKTSSRNDLLCVKWDSALTDLSPVSTTQVDGPSSRVHFLTPVNLGVKKCTRVLGPSSRPVNSGSGNWALTFFACFSSARASLCVIG